MVLARLSARIRAALKGLMSNQKPNYRHVKAEAAALLARFSITSPPIDPIKIAKGIGVSVYFVGFEQHKQNVSGFYDCSETAIFVNKDEYPLRQTFTIAHELGHQVLHKEWASTKEYKVLLRDQDYSGDDFHEKEANAFAAHLLVPRFILNRYWDKMPVEELSQLFAVSVPVIRNRLALEYGI